MTLIIFVAAVSHWLGIRRGYRRAFRAWSAMSDTFIREARS